MSWVLWGKRLKATSPTFRFNIGWAANRSIWKNYSDFKMASIKEIGARIWAAIAERETQKWAAKPVETHAFLPVWRPIFGFRVRQ